MLARKNRFHGHSGVRRVYRYGKPARTAMLSVHALVNDKVKTTKVAVVVSRKVHKSAVKRNRIRRRIYEVVRGRLPAMSYPAEVVITVYKPELAVVPSDELEHLVTQALKKARLIQK